MYGSPQRHHQPPPQSSDLNLPYPPPASSQFSRNPKVEQEFAQYHRSQQQMSSGLLRYRSAPSSLLGELCEDFLPVRASSPETDTMFATLLASDLEKPAAADGPRRSQFEEVSVTAGFAEPPQMVFHQQQQMSSHIGSMAMDSEQQAKSSTSLVRQSSSPAGFFAHLNVDNGFGMMRGIGGFRNATSPSGDSANRLKGQLSFPSRQNSIMSQISELESEEGMDGGSPEDSGGRSFIPGFPIGGWDDPSMLSENNFSGLKRGREGLPGLNTSESQNGDMRNHASGLSHQFSLPKTSSEMAAIEKFLQFQDSVPCKIRAKRGCATHPRSIAERVRRTKISERMRKLQELVPNMDKQTNTSDMLDLAVDYIKDLQKQVKTLSDARASCTCSASGRKSHPNQSG